MDKDKDKDKSKSWVRMYTICLLVIIFIMVGFVCGYSLTYYTTVKKKYTCKDNILYEVWRNKEI